MLGSFTFILHTHLPYVLHHGKWPHGSDWLSEAVAECYLPILGVLEGLEKAEGLAPRISMDFSPINLEQLSDPAFIDVFSAYCDEKIEAAEREILEQKHLLLHFQERYALEVGLLQSEVTEYTTKTHELTLKVPVLEQRLALVEKLLDEGRNRRWQVWLAILSATLALVVALVRK